MPDNYSTTMSLLLHSKWIICSVVPKPCAPCEVVAAKDHPCRSSREREVLAGAGHPSVGEGGIGQGWHLVVVSVPLCLSTERL